MKVRMVAGISGGRGDGTSWPHPGETLIVSDEEGAHLCAARLAVPVAEEEPVELREAESPVKAPLPHHSGKAPSARQRAAQDRPAAPQG